MRVHPILMLAGLLAALAPGAACKLQPEPPPKPSPPPPPFEYLGEWGVKGEGPGQLARPVSLATDAVGNVYIADEGSRFIHKFDPAGHPLLSFQDAGLESPDAIAVDRGGAIYVADPARSSVFIFFPDGTRLRQIRCAHRGGRKEPLRVTVDDDGNVFAVDPGLHRIQKFNPRGRLVKAWDAPGETPGEYAFPVDAAVGPDGFLYVVDARGMRIQKFTREGELVSAWGKNETAPDSIGSLAHVAVSEKYVFAEDAVSRRVHVWTLDGRHKLSDDLGGRLASPGAVPRDLAVSARGELLVLDPEGGRVLRFRINF